MCPGPIRSVQHQKALMIMSRTHAPGEKSYLEEIKEQRVTNFGIHMLMGEFQLLPCPHCTWFSEMTFSRFTEDLFSILIFHEVSSLGLRIDLNAFE